jgi:hypothetical protein
MARRMTRLCWQRDYRSNFLINFQLNGKQAYKKWCQTLYRKKWEFFDFFCVCEKRKIFFARIHTIFIPLDWSEIAFEILSILLIRLNWALAQLKPRRTFPSLFFVRFFNIKICISDETSFQHIMQRIFYTLCDMLMMWKIFSFCKLNFFTQR